MLFIFYTKWIKNFIVCDFFMFYIVYGNRYMVIEIISEEKLEI